MAAVSDTDGVDHISREAGDKTKGFRFQKLRAAIRFLQRVDANRSGQVQCAMELLEDSVLYDGNADALISGEENKYYGSRISFNSSAVKNTVVAFLDLYFTFYRTGELELGVYASAELAQERITAEQREKLGYTAEQKSYDILKKLVQKDELTNEEVVVAFEIAKVEYSKQYKGSNKGYTELVKAMSLDDFVKFIKSIDWSLTNDTNETLEEQALHLVRTCRFFTYRHQNLESYVLSSLLDELEKRSGKKSITDRLLSTDTLKYIFNEILLGPTTDDRVDDPASECWDDVELDDFRNLPTKILSVCPEFNQRTLKALARRCSLARNVEPEGQREMKGFLRRVLDVCEAEFIKNPPSPSMTQQEVLGVIEALTNASEQHTSSLRSNYRYRARDQHAIAGAVLTLFDDCYLAFDEAEDGSQE
ncbi:hypothetical protein J9978_15580 [Chromobacterium violaceum]|uniref:hypothetical protein n=1 Tax=Chromobacterium violaceum TaxID=536 RepID=UPI001B343A25|nr:hypothetical protein [Chromobacterium violaceum]MBP4050909.1 hypothetical protein [Chromobacterium violaceum]